MGPKIVDKSQRKREIALQALELFAQRGFEAASISQIADAVGIGKGTIYEYFSSKEELIQESLVAWMDMFAEGLEGLVAGIEDPEERLRTFVSTSMRVITEDSQAVQLMISVTQLLLNTRDLSSFHFVRDGFQRLRMDIIQMLLEGVSRGIYRPDLAQDAEKIAINLLAYLDGIGMHYYFSNNYFDLDTQVNFFLDQLLESWRVKRSDK